MMMIIITIIHTYMCVSCVRANMAIYIHTHICKYYCDYDHHHCYILLSVSCVLYIYIYSHVCAHTRHAQSFSNGMCAWHISLSLSLSLSLSFSLSLSLSLSQFLSLFLLISVSVCLSVSLCFLLFI